MIFSQKVRLLRKKNGFTQTTFAKEIGVSRQSVYKWEDGQSYPDIKNLSEMRRIFSCSLDDLLDDGMSISDDGTLKTNAEVEYENAHKKKRKPRKDKGIKTGIPPMRKNGEPVVRRKKAVEEPVKEEKKVAAPQKKAAPAPTPAPAPVETVAPVAPAAPAAPVARPSFRTRAAAPAGLTHRDAAAAARAAIAARRLGGGKNALLDDDLDLNDDIDLDDDLLSDEPAAAPAPQKKTAPAAAPAAPKKPAEKRKVASLFNSEAEGTQKAFTPAAEAPKAEKKKAAPVKEEPKKEEKKGGFFSIFRRK